MAPDPIVHTLQSGNTGDDAQPSTVLLAFTDDQLALVGWALNGVANRVGNTTAGRLHHRMATEVLSLTHDSDAVPALRARFTGGTP